VYTIAPSAWRVKGYLEFQTTWRRFAGATLAAKDSYITRLPSGDNMAWIRALSLARLRALLRARFPQLYYLDSLFCKRGEEGTSSVAATIAPTRRGSGRLRHLAQIGGAWGMTPLHQSRQELGEGNRACLALSCMPAADARKDEAHVAHQSGTLPRLFTHPTSLPHVSYLLMYDTLLYTC